MIAYTLDIPIEQLIIDAVDRGDVTILQEILAQWNRVALNIEPPHEALYDAAIMGYLMIVDELTGFYNYSVDDLETAAQLASDEGHQEVGVLLDDRIYTSGGAT